MVQKNIILLIGETASGKTKFIEKYSKEKDIRVINCDSRQIYKYLDIGTAKPDKELLDRVKHYFIDIIEVNEQFSGGDFFRITEEILAKHDNFIISAGTPFYLNIILNGIDEIPPVRQTIRNRVNLLLQTKGLFYLYNELKRIDPYRAEQISPNDTQRIKRALEVFFETGIPISGFFNNKKKLNIQFSKVIYIKKDKEILKRNIYLRTRQMIKDGLVEETQRLIKRYSKKTLYNKKIIGYNETIDYLDKRITFEELPNIIARNTVMYVKRQRTFFKKIIKSLDCEIEYINKE